MKYTCCTILLLFAFITSHAQTPDNSFGTNGKEIIPYYSEYLEISSALQQTDGKMLVSGYQYSSEFYFPSITIWRLNSDGSPDNDFGSDGLVHVHISPSLYGGFIALQGDKIIGLGTAFDRDGEQSDSLILFRLNPNGKFDSTFGKNGKVAVNFGSYRHTAKALLIKPNGKILVAGELQVGHNKGNAVITQFLPNGKPDATFGDNGLVTIDKGLNVAGLAIALTPDNKIVTGVRYTDQDNKYIYRLCLVQLNANGTIDKNFGVKGIVFNKEILSGPRPNMAIAVQPNGKIVEYVSTDNADNALFRYNANGSIDKVFGVNGYVKVPAALNNVSLSIALDIKNERLLINTPKFAITAFTSTGIVDSSFGTNGIVNVDYTDITSNIYDVRSEQVLLLPDSKIFCAGYINDSDGASLALARFLNTDDNSASTTINNFGDIRATLYPNPVTSVLNINGLSSNSTYQLSITDANGNIKAVRKAFNSGVYSWNVQWLNKGVYYLNIKSENQSIAIKFIKL